MQKVKFLPISIILIITLLVAGPSFNVAARPPASPMQVDMGTAQSFAVLAGAGITNTGTTTISGDVGTYSTTTETGMGSCPAAGCVNLTGTNHAGDGITQGAKIDLTAAYLFTEGEGPKTTVTASSTDSFGVGTINNGNPLTAGVFNSASSMGLTGTLILDGQNNPDAVFVFQAGSTLTTASSSKVVLTGGAQACNVYWQVGSSATLGTTTAFQGTILALESITMNTSATLIGQALARNGAVTLDTNTITRPLCSPTISTTLSANPVIAGGSVNDTSVLLGDTRNSSGTVTYTVYSDNACSLNPQSAGTKAVVNGIVGDSDSINFPTAGIYYWQASYTGDVNNNSAKSACTSEALLVNAPANVTPTLTTDLSNISVSVGSSVYDTATLTGAAASAGGTVSYTYYTDSACTLNAVDAGTKTVTGTGNSVPNSNFMPFNLAGTYYWQAVYSGGTGTNGAVSTCNVPAETLTVSKLSPTIATTLSDASVLVGSAVHDHATLNGATASAIGTVTYTVYTNNTCTLNPQTAGIKNVVNGSVGDSDSINFPTAGIYYWQVSYTGDVNNNSAESACSSEVLLVNAPANVTPTLTTNLSNTRVAVGSSVYDTATLTGAAASAGGTVTYTYYTDSACTLNAVDAGTKTVTGAGSNVPNSNSMLFNSAGTYYWQAVYSGGTGTNAAVSTCNVPSETLTVYEVPQVVNTTAVLPASGFAPYQITVLSLQSADKDYSDLGDIWLEIPRLSVQIPIVGIPRQANGEWDISWLGNQAGWLNGSAYPTWSGNSVLTAHVFDANGNPGPFVALSGLKWGDKVIIHIMGEQYIYEVRQVTQVKPEAIKSVFKHKELPYITLITCRGYDETTNSYKYRVIVGAVLVEVK